MMSLRMNMYNTKNMQKVKKENTGCLSEKDLQLIRKTYCNLAQLYYENPHHPSVVNDLINYGRLIIQVIADQNQSQVLALIPIIEPLKIKSKSKPELLTHIEIILKHLKCPSKLPITYDTLLYSFQKSDLFTVGCTIAIRFYQQIYAYSSQFHWRQIIEELSRNIPINPTLCIQLCYLICKQSEMNSRCAVKSGLIKYVFLSYIGSTLNNRYHLHKAIKLLKVVASAEETLLRDKEKGLALVIYTYDDYVPVVEGILAKCYDSEYCQAVDKKRKYDSNTIDQPYLWSYLQNYCLHHLTRPTIKELLAWLRRPISEVEQKKIYGIMSNYSKFKKQILKEVLQIMPKSQEALLNYIKLCVNCCELDLNSNKIIDMPQLQQLVDKSPNAKVTNLFKYLGQLSNRERKIGVLSENHRKMFDMQKNADFMMERATRIPQSNQDLQDIKQILKQKDRVNQFQSDTLKTLKQKSLHSLHTAIMQKKKLDLNIILREIDLGDVRLLTKLLQILQLCLTINQDLIPTIDLHRFMEIISWIEDNYNGEIIQWGSIGQLIIILTDQGQWKHHFHQITEKCFWFLNIQEPSKQDQALIWEVLSKFGGEMAKNHHKIPFLIGFLGRALTTQGKLRLYTLFKHFFDVLTENIKNNTQDNYKTSLIMLSQFLKNWYSDDQNDNKNNRTFETIIEPLVRTVLVNFRGLEQQYQFLQSCIPFKLNYSSLTDNLDYLLSLYGRLASYIYHQAGLNGQKVQINYQRIKIIGRLPPLYSRNILQILNFMYKNSELMQTDQLSNLLTNLINENNVYWFVYPNFYNILSRIVSILTYTLNSVIISHITDLLFRLIKLVNDNPDISPDQRLDILTQIKRCLEVLAKRGVPIDKDKLRRVVDKIADQELKDQIVSILINYKIKENTQGDIKKETQISQQFESNILHSLGNQEIQQAIQEVHSKSQTSQKRGLVIEIVDNSQKQEEMQVIEALRMLKKINEEKESQNRFPQLYNIFVKKQLQSQHIDILGHLLARFYPKRPQLLQQKAIELLLDKNKTRLSRQWCYELLSHHPETFCLAKRWKLVGKQWMDLAMLRFSQGYFPDASQVAEHNLSSNCQLSYFHQKQYQELIIDNFAKLSTVQDHTNVLMLIGTSARNMQIKTRYYREKIHFKILQLVSKYIQDPKFLANILYALSSLVYNQQQICADLIKFKPQFQGIFAQLNKQQQNRAIIQSGACLVANLSYYNQEVKQTLRQLNVVPIFMKLFESIVNCGEMSTFKQILRAFGNLSLSSKCSHQLIDGHFCQLVIKMIENIDISTNFDQKAPIVKVLLDLTANLTSHRYKLEIFHKQKLTDFLLTLLETTHTHLPILTTCIDIIDCLCQNPQIQNFMVSDRKIPFILIDILKIQSDEKIVIKSTRLLTNLTINPACIPHILNANLLNVLANIVMPHFYGNKIAAEKNKKMQSYILKILSRVFNSKPDRQTILKSGYIDCIIKTIETSDHIEDAYIELFYVYADNMPNFLNKRAFICLIKVLTQKINHKEFTIKSLRAIKKLSSFYQRDQVDVLIPGTAEVYVQLLSSDIKDQGLDLLSYHLMRSGKLRHFLSQQSPKVIELVRKLGEDNSGYLEISRQIIFLIYNPFLILEENQSSEYTQQQQQLKKGFNCKLFRMDGSSKKAIISMNNDYELRAYKYPDGQVKDKYVIDIRTIRDFQANFPFSEQLWQATIFSKENGLFDLAKSQPQNCCTLISSKKWGVINFINIEFECQEDKIRFFGCLRTVYSSLR